MKRTLFVLLVAFAMLPGLVYASGGGGIEYLTNVGPDLLPSLALPGGVSLPTGSVIGFSGFGYGVTRGGWKIGGFGLFLYTDNVSVPVPSLSSSVNGAVAGFGGVISGGQARLGPFRLSLNLRLGAGVIGVRLPYEHMSPMMMDAGTACLFGSIDGEVGLLFVPAMLVSVYGGLGSIAPIIPFYGPVPIASFIAGVRITWGSF